MGWNGQKRLQEGWGKWFCGEPALPIFGRGWLASWLIDGYGMTWPYLRYNGNIGLSSAEGNTGIYCRRRPRSLLSVPSRIGFLRYLAISEVISGARSYHGQRNLAADAKRKGKSSIASHVLHGAERMGSLTYSSVLSSRVSREEPGKNCSAASDKPAVNDYLPVHAYSTKTCTFWKIMLTSYLIKITYTFVQ